MPPVPPFCTVLSPFTPTPGLHYQSLYGALGQLYAEVMSMARITSSTVEATMSSVGEHVSNVTVEALIFSSCAEDEVERDTLIREDSDGDSRDE